MPNNVVICLMRICFKLIYLDQKKNVKGLFCCVLRNEDLSISMFNHFYSTSLRLVSSRENWLLGIAFQMVFLEAVCNYLEEYTDRKLVFAFLWCSRQIFLNLNRRWILIIVAVFLIKTVAHWVESSMGFKEQIDMGIKIMCVCARTRLYVVSGRWSSTPTRHLVSQHHKVELTNIDTHCTCPGDYLHSGLNQWQVFLQGG